MFEVYNRNAIWLDWFCIIAVCAGYRKCVGKFYFHKLFCIYRFIELLHNAFSIHEYFIHSEIDVNFIEINYCILLTGIPDNVLWNNLDLKVVQCCSRSQSSLVKIWKLRFLQIWQKLLGNLCSNRRCFFYFLASVYWNQM